MRGSKFFNVYSFLIVSFKTDFVLKKNYKKAISARALICVLKHSQPKSLYMLCIGFISCAFSTHKKILAEDGVEVEEKVN